MTIGLRPSSAKRRSACSRWASLEIFELDILDAGLGLELLGAAIGGLVEGFVELAAEIEQEAGLDVGLRDRPWPSSRLRPGGRERIRFM
jgi:hypothetical protein